MGSPSHLLRLLISCRKITAQVTISRTDTIVAMACSSEQALSPTLSSRLPRARSFWDARAASKVGEKLGVRLKEIGISDLDLDVDEEASRPTHHRKATKLLFRSVERAGVRVAGAEMLRALWLSSS